jgi:hypothetical protein
LLDAEEAERKVCSDILNTLNIDICVFYVPCCYACLSISAQM